MKILVTGGGGFLGKAIVQQLLARGDAVRSFARGNYPALLAMGAEVQQGDLSDFAAVQTAVMDCDAVIHVAAKAGQWGSYESYYQPNVVGTENIIRACQMLGIERLVFTSSPSVVDAGETIAGGDEHLPYPQHFVSHYSATKALAEQAILAANTAQLATVALRPPLIWGIGDNHLLPRILARAEKGRLVRLGRGDYLVDTTYIDNAAAAHILALDQLNPAAPIAGKVYFLSNDEPRPVHQMINDLVQAAGFPPAKRQLPVSVAYGIAWLVEKAYRALRIQQEPPLTTFLVSQLSKARWFDISAAKQELGYQAHISIDEGLARLHEHYQSARA